MAKRGFRIMTPENNEEKMDFKIPKSKDVQMLEIQIIEKCLIAEMSKKKKDHVLLEKFNQALIEKRQELNQ